VTPLVSCLPYPVPHSTHATLCAASPSPRCCRAVQAEKGGEDAYFISGAGCGAIGVADGVGGWAEQAVDSAAYSRDVMAAAARAVDGSAGRLGESAPLHIECATAPPPSHPAGVARRASYACMAGCACACGVRVWVGACAVHTRVLVVTVLPYRLLGESLCHPLPPRQSCLCRDHRSLPQACVRCWWRRRRRCTRRAAARCALRCCRRAPTC
jgi:hypothetical protein